MTIVILLITPFVIIALGYQLTRLTRGIGFVPIYILIVGYLIVAVGGAVYALVVGPFLTGVSAVIDMTNTEVGETLAFWLVCVASFEFGACACLQSVAEPGIATIDLNYLMPDARSLIPPTLSAATFMTLLTIAALVFGIGVEAYLHSVDYLTVEHRSLRSIATVLFPLASFCTGFAFATSKTLVQKVASMILLLGLTFSLLMTASRSAGVVPLLCATGYLLVARNRISRARAAILLSCSVFVGLLLTVLALHLRSGFYDHGLIPYSRALWEGIVGSGPSADMADAAESTLGNFLFGFSLSSAVKVENPGGIPWSVLATELNPLPGFITEWSDIYQEYRLNAFTPYSLVGEMYASGYLFSFAFFAMVGALFAYCGRAVGLLQKWRARALPLAIVAALIFFVPFSTQYNTRNSVRPLYYALFSLAAMSAFRSLLRSRIKSSMENRASGPQGFVGTVKKA